MKRQTWILAAVLCGLLLPSAMIAADRPVILGPVLNGASFEGFVPTELPVPLAKGAGLAGGSIFVLFGTDLGPAELAQGSVPYPDQLPAAAGGTRVMFRSLVDERVYSAPLIHSVKYQVSGIVPSPLPVGMAEVTVSYDGMESEPVTAAIVEYSPALFTISQTGRGPVVAQNYESATAQPLNTLTHPVSPGQYLILWGTGLGPIEGPDNIAPAAGNLRDDVIVTIGNVEVPAEYAGRSPEFPGVDQINVRVPEDGSVELGCYQDIGLKIGNSRFGVLVSISISDTPGECEHPWGLSAEKLSELDAGGNVTFMEATLSPELTVVEAARLDAYRVSQNRPQWLISGAFINPLFPFPGSCLPATVLAPPVLPEPVGRPVRHEPGELGLSLGDSVEFAGPGARAFSLPKSEFDPTAYGPVFDLGENKLAPGQWTLSAAGGADLGAFSSSFTVPGLPDLILPETVPLGGDMEITWDGSAYQESDRIRISLRHNPQEFPSTGVRSLRCDGAATRGSVKVTAEQLAWLEAEPGSPLLWEVGVESTPQAIEAEGLDYGRLTTLVSSTVEATAEE